MIISLWKEPNLRGHAFEFIAKAILRREKNNNFIFTTSIFDSIDEILTKYRLVPDPKLDTFIDYLRKEWKRCDILEFLHENRVIKNIKVYDAKTKIHSVKRDVYEFCKSNFMFFNRCESFSIETYIISIIIFENWRFSYSIRPFSECKVREYSRFFGSRKYQGYSTPKIGLSRKM